MPDTPRNLTWRVVLFGLILLALANVWIRFASLITFGANIDNSVPPAPAMAAILLVLGLNKLAHGVSRRLALRQGEILCLYAVLLIGVPLTSLGIVRPFLPSITALQYFATPENDFGRLAADLPHWLAPQGSAVIQQYYEGAPDERVPWSAWTTPLGAWTLLFAAFFVVLLGLASLLRHQWSDRDRLTFPLVTFNLELTGVEKTAEGVAFLGSPLMWVGFALAFLYNAGNVANALNPGVKALGQVYDLGQFLTEHPWDALRPLVIYYRPEFVGLGYFVPLEILFSTWLFYGLIRVESLLGRMTGWEPAGFPFEARQGLGGYLGMALVLLYMARGSLARMGNASAEGRRPLLALLAVPVGLVVIVAWCSAAGMSAGLAALYFAAMLLVAVTFSRIRGETGTPSNWAFPFGEAKRGLLELTGSGAWGTPTHMGSLTIFSVLNFLSRGYFPSLMAYQMENLEMARRGGVRLSEMTGALFVGLIGGLAAAYVMHLQAFYQYGANVLEGGTTGGGYRTQMAVQEFDLLSGLAREPSPPQVVASIFGGLGGVLTVALALLRFRFLRLPLHPLGFCLATSYGYLMWGSFALVWAVKALVVRLGGARLYRRLAPLFLGIAFGHFFTAGILWGAFSIFLPKEMFRNLHIDIS